MAPEQLRSEPLDARSDIYSLGVVLFELLVGERPFVGSGEMDLLNKMLLNPAPPVRTRNPTIDEPLAAIADRMLARDPADRPISAEWVARELDLWRASQVVTDAAIVVQLGARVATCSRGSHRRVQAIEERRGPPTAILHVHTDLTGELPTASSPALEPRTHPVARPLAPALLAALVITVCALVLGWTVKGSPSAPASEPIVTSQPTGGHAIEPPRSILDDPATPGSARADPAATTIASAAPTVQTQTSAKVRPIDKARELYLSGDKNGARAVLEPRVLGGRASEEEIMFLVDICKEQSDFKCMSRTAELSP
jgi:serine/threonine protein kinase